MYTQLYNCDHLKLGIEQHRFFWQEMSIQIFCLFHDWLLCFFVAEVFFFFCSLQFLILILCQMNGFHMFIPFHSLSFHFVNCFLFCVTSFSVWSNPICLFLLLVPEFGHLAPRITANVLKYFLCFLLLVSASWLTFKHFTRFQLVFEHLKNIVYVGSRDQEWDRQADDAHLFVSLLKMPQL